MPVDGGKESIKLALAGQTQGTVNGAHFGLTASRAAVGLDYADAGTLYPFQLESSGTQTDDSAHFTVVSIVLS